jgi:hypothetical protein
MTRAFYTHLRCWPTPVRYGKTLDLAICSGDVWLVLHGKTSDVPVLQVAFRDANHSLLVFTKLICITTRLPLRNTVFQKNQHALGPQSAVWRAPQA